MQAARLSCEQCQARKTKCDKNLPCSACVKGGHQCTPVHRQRLPRGRSGRTRNREDALKARIGRLESVVTQLQTMVPGGGSPGQEGIRSDVKDGQEGERDEKPDLLMQTSNPASGTVEPNESAEPGTLNRLIAPTFWTELSDAVSGLRDALEETKLDDESTPESLNDQHSKSDAASSEAEVRRFSGSGAVLFANMSADPSTKTLDWLPPATKTFLITTYRDRVDPIIKPTHWPTVAMTIGFGMELVSTARLGHGPRALEAAICLHAACILSEEELNGRDAILSRCRLAAEQCLNEAGLLSTMDFTVLQAFAIYVATLRLCQCNADQWTLLACVIRIASAQGLNAKGDARESVLDREIRLRLWFNIGLLDLQAAFDRGTKPLLSTEDFPAWPADIDDDQLALTPSEDNQTSPSSPFTSMTFPLMTYLAMITQHRLSNINVLQPGRLDPLTDLEIWHEKVQITTTFETHAANLSQQFQNLGSRAKTFDRLIARSAQYILSNIRMVLHRPIYPPVQGRPPPDQELNLLQHSTMLIEHSLSRDDVADEEFKAWSTWVPWYALAVLLAELCRCQQTPEAERGWRVAERGYVTYSQQVADGQAGLLWKPLERLMQRARAVWRRAPFGLGMGGADAEVRAGGEIVKKESESGGSSSELGGQSGSANYLDPLLMPVAESDEAMSWFDWEYFLEGFGDDSMMQI